MRLAYLVMVHKNPSQVARLLRAIHDPDNYYVIHIDKRSAGAEWKPVSATIAEHDNIHALRSQPVWNNGFSSVDVELKGLGFLLNLAADWSFFTLLSGQDYPLKSQSAIMSCLENHLENSFLEWFDPFEHWGQQDAFSRATGLFLELPFTRRITKIPLPRVDRRSWLRPGKWYGGAQWVILNRSFSEYLVQPAIRAWLQPVFRHTRTPDETYIQTAIMNSRFKTTVINDPKRYIVWADEDAAHPGILTTDDYQNLANSGAFFARKFDSSVDANILDLLDRTLLCTT